MGNWITMTITVADTLLTVASQFYYAIDCHEHHL